MGRAPCCEKTGLKKGPWTTQEDQILIFFIQQNGHPNWRALPKQAGLLRCGKSCRLRWINYLHPDIKRGNYTVDEEKTIIKLHEMLGNRWSAIAAKLPGRTDNEIKNVWHTHLKKKVKKSSQEKSESGSEVENPSSPDDHDQSSSENYYSSSYSTATDNSITTAETMNNNTTTTTVDQAANIEDPLDFLPVIDDFFWSDSSETVDQNIASLPLDSTSFEEFQYQVEDSFISGDGYGGCTPDVKFDEDMDYWYNILVNAGGTQERSCFN